MGNFNFDQLVDRRASSSTKWQKFAPDVLPMWVADMDFAAPEFILEEIKARLAHPILGYTDRPDSLNEAFLAWLQTHFEWQIDADWLVWLPGVVPGLNLGCRTLPKNRRRIMLPTPVYHPFLELAENSDCPETRVPMTVSEGHWSMDISQLEAALLPDTTMLLLCNPQNPRVGFIPQQSWMN